MMFRRAIPAILLIVLAGSLPASDRPLTTASLDVQAHGRPVGLIKSEVDTVYLLGDALDPQQSPLHNGTFQDAAGQAAWTGWAHEDLTAQDETHWHVSEFMAPQGQYAMWCGTTFDGDPGYGNDWHDTLVFTHMVDDPTGAVTVQWRATLRHDVEDEYDHVYLQWNRGGVWTTLEQYTGTRTVEVDQSVTYEPGDYVGEAADRIQLRVQVVTDSIWSDEDQLWPSDGACQYDDVTVMVDGVVVDLEDFEDQVSDRWEPVTLGGCGDFAALYTNLQDEDPCRSNWSPQVAFVDDGVVVPGTGGTPGITWRYGPGGYIVNNTGGLLGDTYGVHNVAVSPAMTWPAGCDAAILAFDMYAHEELGSVDWPGIFGVWYVRSIDTGDPADLVDAPWINNNLVLYGGPEYRRVERNIGDLLVTGRTHVQVAVGLRDIDWFAWVGIDGTPAPYYDNLQLRAFPYEAPSITARTIDLFNDGFPAAGEIDLDDLARNAVRLDGARSIAPPEHLHIDPADSVTVDVAVLRAGAELVEPPRMHVHLLANPVFDAVRVLPPGFSQQGGVVGGWVAGAETHTDGGIRVPDRFHFDLPDSGFFYPGDVMRYYFWAADEVAGDVGETIVPADTAGFASLDRRLTYPEPFVVRALPTLRSDAPGDQPSILFWQDGHGTDGQEIWLNAIEQLGYDQGWHYDIYATSAPSSRLGNGLGGRATVEVIADYETLVYTSGSLDFQSLAGGDFMDDPSDDIGLLTGWFELGDKGAIMTGDDLVTGVLNQGDAGSAFAARFLQVDLVDNDVSDLINAQVAPLVRQIPGNGVIPSVEEWIAAGGCPGIRSFDAVAPIYSATRLAEFTDPNGNDGAYPYAAAWYAYDDDIGARVVAMPYDLGVIQPAPGWEPPGWPVVDARAVLLDDMLWFLGEGLIIPPPGVGDTPAATTTARCYPNPFNPQTTIALELARTGDVEVTIYNVRGERVRRVVDARLDAGHHDLLWDGRDDTGQATASGVYFYEVQAPDARLVEKLTLVR